MPIIARAHLELSAMKDGFPFGPWVMELAAAHTEFVGSYIQVATLTLAQIIGGVSPSLAAITTIEWLIIRADQALLIGLHGVNAQTSGFTLDQYAPLVLGGGSVNALQIYNGSASTVTIFLGIGGS